MRIAQEALAREVITFLHGSEEYEKAKKISKALFTDEIKTLDAKTLKVNFKDVPSFVINEDINIIDLLVNNKICSSKRESREFLSANSISLNGEKITDENLIVTKQIAIDNTFVIIRRGKKKYYMGIFK